MIVFYVVIFFVACIIQVPLAWSGKDVWGLALDYSNIAKMVGNIFIFPTLYACGFSVFVMLISFVVKPVAAMVIFLGLFSLSSFKSILINPCTYSMLCRYQKNYFGFCVSRKEGILVIAIVTIISVIIGYKVLQRYDVCKGRE